MILLAIALAAAQPVPPGYRQWEKDVCTERNSLRSDSACYAAWLRERLCTWPIALLADTPEFRRLGERRADRRVRAAIEQVNSCD